MIRDLRKALKFFETEGARGLYHGLRRRSESRRRDRIYQDWIAWYDTFTDQEETEIARRIADFPLKPLISVLMPVYDVGELWLRKAIRSVLDQSYPNWELCIADDNSPSPHIRKVLDEFASQDPRIKVVYREQNGHISAASNSALKMAEGEFSCLLDHDDELALNALYFVIKEINESPETDMIYSDEDKIDTRGRRSSPSFKPDWSPELFYSLNLITHLSVYRTAILREIGGFRMGFEGSQDYDLGLRFSEQVECLHIRHIPQILYHWRSIPGSVALDSSEKDYAHRRARESIAEHFARTGVQAQVSRGYRELHRINYILPQPPPRISLIVSGDNADRILSQTDYSNIELISIEGEKGKRNFASLNAAAGKATGSVICFLDAATRAMSQDWLTELVRAAIQKNVGAVGPKLLYPDGSVKSAGLIIGVKGGVGRVHHKAGAYSSGNFFRLRVMGNVSALPVDGFAIRKDIFNAVNGFDNESFPEQYADVDLCLRLLEKNYRNVWTPWSELIQPDERSFSAGVELDLFKARWPHYLERDPYYNPNLTQETEDLSLAFPPRVSKM
jgi:glycosyltransferase involved in cell wall biosynthesis